MIAVMTATCFQVTFPMIVSLAHDLAAIAGDDVAGAPHLDRFDPAVAWDRVADGDLAKVAVGPFGNPGPVACNSAQHLPRTG